jgi:hypothetical protein
VSAHLATKLNLAEGLTDTKKRRRKIMKAKDPARAVVEAIARDIGDEVVAYIEVMYPNAIKATSSTFRRSIKGTIFNEIMASLEVTDEGLIVARIQDRQKFRRWWTAQYRKIRHPKIQP